MATSTSTTTSAPPPVNNESKPAIVKAAARGDLETVRRIVEAAALISIAEKNKTINQAPIWTEILSMEENVVISSGEHNPNPQTTPTQTTTKTIVQEWYDVTAVTMAAMRGHHHILQCKSLKVLLFISLRSDTHNTFRSRFARRRC